MSFDIPVIQTERLTLRGPKLEDFEPICAYFRDPRSAFNGGPHQPLDVGRMLMICMGQWHLRGYGLWQITLRDDDAFIGFTGVFHPFHWPEPELGFGITAPYEGKGVAFEAASAARRAAADLFGFASLPSFIAPDNIRAQALASRMGATREDDIILADKPARVYRHPKQEAA